MLAIQTELTQEDGSEFKEAAGASNDPCVVPAISRTPGRVQASWQQARGKLAKRSCVTWLRRLGRRDCAAVSCQRVSCELP